MRKSFFISQIATSFHNILRCRATITMNIVELTIIFTPYTPMIYRFTSVIFFLALRNVVVCHIYRRTKLELGLGRTAMPSSLANSQSLSLQFASNPSDRGSQVVPSSETTRPWVLPPIEDESRSWGGIV